MENTPVKRTPRGYARLFFTGFAMGAADIVPGVSGGTMAFILGIYEELLNAIKSFNFHTARLVLSARLNEALQIIPWRFLMVLGLGLATAILSLSSGLSWLLENERSYLYAFFFGLILASIVAVGIRINRWYPLTMVSLVAGIIVAFIIVSLDPAQNADHSTPVLFFSGMIAIMAMILPGISGSFILLLLGQYEYVLNAVRDFDLRTIFTVAAGCAVGIMGFSRVLSWLLKRYEQVTIAALVGFMIGALPKLWPWQEEIDPNMEHAEEFTRRVLPDFASTEFLFALSLMLLGFLLVSFLDHLQSGQNPVFVQVERLLGRRRLAAASADQ
ncbi:MAG: DUF368 domain-containing protein [Anaerolineae bacterium]|nr:DUF368 domain-containing protein [Anaerolineae bacterium]